MQILAKVRRQAKAAQSIQPPSQIQTTQETRALRLPVPSQSRLQVPMMAAKAMTRPRRPYVSRSKVTESLFTSMKAGRPRDTFRVRPKRICRPRT